MCLSPGYLYDFTTNEGTDFHFATKFFFFQDEDGKTTYRNGKTGTFDSSLSDFDYEQQKRDKAF